MKTCTVIWWNYSCWICWPAACIYFYGNGCLYIDFLTQNDCFLVVDESPNKLIIWDSLLICNLFNYCSEKVIHTKVVKSAVK